MADETPQQQVAQPKHPFYKSKSDGSIYPAMSSPPGYEDKHPEDWEPASDAEIAAEREKFASAREERKAELRAQSAAADEAPVAVAVAKPAKQGTAKQEAGPILPPLPGQ